MTLRLIRVWLLAAVAGTGLSLIAQTPPTPVAGGADPAGPRVAAGAPSAQAADNVITLKLPDAPLELVLQQIEKMTGRTILRPQTLPTPAISISATLPQSEMLLALETLLNLNGVGLVRMDDKFLKVVALQMVRTEAPQMIEGSTLKLPASGQIATKLFQLDFLRVGEFLPQITPLLNPNLGGPVIFEKANAALITDSITTLQRLEMLLAKLDQPLITNLSPKFYNVRFAKASDLVTKLRAMFQGPLQLSIGSATSYSADDRTNQIVLISDPRQHAFFDDLVAKLDVKSDPNTRNDVIYLKHAAAKDVSTLLSQLVAGQTKASQTTNSVVPGQVVQPGQQPVPQVAAVAAVLGDVGGSTQFSSLVTVIPDERSNAVVVNGTVDDIRLIRDLIDKIDVLLAQVRIEVVIAEVALTDASQTGISSLGLNVHGNKLEGIVGTGGSSGAGITVGGTTADGSTTTPTGFALLPGDVSLVGIVSLSTTPRKNYSTILSTPTITTTHNKEAKLFFGETRPVVTGVTSTTGNTDALARSSSLTEKEIGTTLSVKPLIGNDGSVELDIKQTITDVTGKVIVDGNEQYIIGKRDTNSYVTVKSGEIIVLGGIQKNNYTRTTSRLGPIPFIGDLLGARSRSKIRTELVVFIRPYVLTNTEADNVPAIKQIDTMPHADQIRETIEIPRTKVGPPQKN